MEALMHRVFLANVVLLLLPCGAFAHAVGAHCTMQGDMIEVRAYFDDDTPARAALVKVFAAAERILVQGKTDDKGQFSFAKLEPGQYVVEVNAGGGHRTEVKIRVPRPDQQASRESATLETISQGPSREEFTRYPWLKVGIGLGGIGGVALAFWLARSKRRTCDTVRAKTT